MTSLTKNPQPPSKTFFSSADWKTCRVFWRFDQVRNLYKSGDIPAQSHVHLGVFFWKSPKAAGRQSVNSTLETNRSCKSLH